MFSNSTVTSTTDGVDLLPHLILPKNHGMVVIQDRLAQRVRIFIIAWQQGMTTLYTIKKDLFNW